MKKIIFALVFLLFFSFTNVSASPTDGTIDTTFKYAWSSNVGWINFNTAGGNIYVTDTQLSGYAWSKNNGWINLKPATGGVANNREGTLSGYAWGDHLGWINFSGVTIDTSGRFHGQATGDDIGTLTFDCTYCDVRTDWRPASARKAATTDSTLTSANIGGGVGILFPEERLVPARQISPQATAIAPLPTETPTTQEKPGNTPVPPEQPPSQPPRALFDVIIQPAIQYGKTYIIPIMIGFIISLSILIYLVHRMRMKKRIDRTIINQPPISMDYFNESHREQTPPTANPPYRDTQARMQSMPLPSGIVILYPSEFAYQFGMGNFAAQIAALDAAVSEATRENHHEQKTNTIPSHE